MFGHGLGNALLAAVTGASGSGELAYVAAERCWQQCDISTRVSRDTGPDEARLSKFRCCVATASVDYSALNALPDSFLPGQESMSLTFLLRTSV